MNIKQASQASGISSRNIRYYEQAGLLQPDRDPQNGYRTYSENDIRTLKLIRMLRMLDMPVEEIRAVLQGTIPLSQAAQRQTRRLQPQVKALESAIRFCTDLEQDHVEASALDVDVCLARMQTVPAANWFTDWVQDYQTMARAEHRRSFTFTPDTPVTNPAQFTDALFAYAKEQKLDLVVTRESMTPHFTIDGVEYRAQRRYYPVRGIPTARIHCMLCDPDFAEEETPRLRILRLIHYAMPAFAVAAVALLFLIPRGLLLTWWGILFLVGCIAAGVCSAWYNARLFYNDKDNQPHHS